MLLDFLSSSASGRGHFAHNSHILWRLGCIACSLWLFIRMRSSGVIFSRQIGILIRFYMIYRRESSFLPTLWFIITWTPTETKEGESAYEKFFIHDVLLPVPSPRLLWWSRPYHWRATYSLQCVTLQKCGEEHAILARFQTMMMTNRRYLFSSLTMYNFS